MRWEGRPAAFSCSAGSMSNRQIAQELGISEKSVEYHVTKALKQLRTDLKDYLPLIYLFLGI